LLETRVIGLHFCCWEHGPIFIHFFVMGSEIRVLSAIQCVSPIQGHPRSWFWYQSKSVCDFLLVIHSTLGPILHLFWDTATYFCYPI